MAEAIIGPLVGRLQEVAVGEARALVGVNADIHRLRDKLMWLQAFLREADTRRRAVTDEVTRVWTLQTRDAVFDAEDALDHYHLHVDMSRYPRWARPTMIYLETFTIQVRMRRGLSRKIRAINMRLDGIIENKDKYKIEDSNKKTDVTWKPSTSTSINYTHRKLDDVHDSDAVINVEEHKQLEYALVNNLTEHQVGKEHYPVMITVSGESGIGKTTLVRDIYKKMEKKKVFQVQAMESFAPYLTAPNILQQITQQLTEDDTNCPKEKAQKMLQNKLKNKKYLLVIDGEVSGTEWKHFLTSIPVGTRGSRVVHITQGLVQTKVFPSEWVKIEEAHEASFVEVHSHDDIPTLTSARRLSLRNYTDKYAVLAHPLPKLRSIFSQYEQEPNKDLEEVSEELTLERTLGEMIHLEFLSIWHISHVNVKALSGALDKLESLRTLILEGKIIPSNVFTTASLRRVKFMFLSGDLVHSSDLDDSEFFCLPNLIMLSLEKTYVTQEFINKLSELPFLATLALYPGSYKDKKLVFASSKFPRLKKIKMIDVEVLEIVEVEVSMVPELKELEIHSPFTGCYHDIDLGNDKKRSQKTRIVVDLKKENNYVHEENDDMSEWWMIFE
ncbi:unnamed protein product [Miscanthus lutarioriparius]|uniref:Disease resistance protein n=1 Tax=Miscanthus lutarioriparius TaxID=422564 RepID=A0A811RFS6_9POAL|nr:unnamed protein product [Miscanthus lutarioriparius]